MDYLLRWLIPLFLAAMAFLTLAKGCRFYLQVFIEQQREDETRTGLAASLTATILFLASGMFFLAAAYAYKLSPARSPKFLPRWPPVFSVLDRWLKSSHPYLKMAGLKVLYHLDPIPPSYAPKVIGQFDSQGSIHRTAKIAYRVLERIGRPAVPLLLIKLDPSQPYFIRLQAIAALAWLGKKAVSTVPQLIQVMIHDPNQFIRHDAARALSWIGPRRREVRKAMKIVYDNDPYHWLRYQAYNVLSTGSFDFSCGFGDPWR